MQEKDYWDKTFYLLDSGEVEAMQASHDPHDWDYHNKTELVNPNGEFVQGYGYVPVNVATPTVRVCKICKKTDVLVLGKALNRITKEIKSPIHIPDYSVIDWIINPDLSAVKNVPVKYWKITNDVVSEMNQSEKDVVDLTLVPSAKINKKISIKSQGDALVYSQGYTTEVKQSFLSMYSEGEQNNVKYIQPLIDWFKQVDTEVISKQNAVDLATTLSEIDAITIDSSTLIAADPQITIEGAHATKILRQKNFQISSYDSLKRLSTVISYDTDNGDGTYSGKAEKVTYSYFENKTTLLSRKVEVFCYDGSVFSEENFNYYKNSNNETIEKKI